MTADKVATLSSWEGGERPAKSMVPMAIACLHVGAALYVAIGVLFALLIDVPSAQDALFDRLTPLAAFTLMAAIPEAIAFGLAKRKHWAWVAGLSLFGWYTVGGFLPLGVLGLWGLLSEKSRAEFGADPGLPEPPRAEAARPEAVEEGAAQAEAAAAEAVE